MKKPEQKIAIVCFGGEDWWYHNRGHADFQLMKSLAKNHTVLYINSIVMQKPTLANGKRLLAKLYRKTKSILRGLKKTNVGFWVYSPFSIPLHDASWLRRLNNWLLKCQIHRKIKKLGIEQYLLWVACPAACDVAMQMNKRKLVYQRTDIYESYPNVPTQIIKKYDLKLKAEADLTLFASRLLYRRESPQCKKALYLDHGVDFEMFAAAERLNTSPPDIAKIPKPVVGYFGSINGYNSTDVELIENVAALLPEMSFVLIGKTESDCKNLTYLRNVWLLGQKPYEQIPHYGKFFDVAIMPWRQNEWVTGCSPIKLKEYLALGKPVVSTPFEQLKKYRNIIYQAKTPQDFAESIKKALVENNGRRIAARRKMVAEDSWQSKAELVMKHLFHS